MAPLDNFFTDALISESDYVSSSVKWINIYLHTSLYRELVFYLAFWIFRMNII